MANYNKVIIAGNLTRDIELKYTQGGTAVTEVGLAINDKRKDASGNYVDDTSFADVTLWGKTAELASQYLGKGSNVMFEGRLKQDTWEQNGQKRSKLKVVAERMVFLGGKNSGGGGHSGNQQGQQNQYSAEGPGPQHQTEEEDIPF